ncbi:MAG TPA: hypothetical protein EYH30_02265 [Anaerolineales bacterium]|nr:hypothetical protein [Anaerolineae bacterium]HIQ00947.1 hypothetical protein [Anaerolineales bacterium]
MAKKARKKRKRSKAPRLSAAQLVQPSEEVTLSRPTSTARTAPAQPSDLREEYHYVMADLKRIAAIAAAMLMVMIALALLLV